MRINLDEVKRLVTGKGDFQKYITIQLNQCLSKGEPPFLSDIIAGYGEGGMWIMRELAERYNTGRGRARETQFFWKLFCVRDAWGNKLYEGDIVYRRINKPLWTGSAAEQNKKYVSNNQLNLDKISGTYDQKWVEFIPYEVDEKGCIECEFRDAAFLIQQFGMHPVSKRGGPPLSMHLKEKHPEEVTAPDGNKLYSWYWRYMEADKAFYEKLPKVGKRKEPRLGFKNGEETPSPAVSQAFEDLNNMMIENNVNKLQVKNQKEFERIIAENDARLPEDTDR